jgi:hypothetical protein
MLMCERGANGCVVVFTVEKRGLGKTCGKKNGREAILGVLREGQW